MFRFGSTSQNTNVLGPPVGTSVPYKVVLGGEEKPRLGNLTIKYKVKFWPITFMSQYSNKSFEELRFEDYNNGRKNKIIQVPSDDTPQLATTMSNFSPSSYTLLHDVQMINADTQPTSLYSTAGNESFGSKAAVTALNARPFGIYNGHILGSTCNFGTGNGNPHDGTIGTVKGVSTNSSARISEGQPSFGSFNFGLASNNTSNLGSLANSNCNNFAFNNSISPTLGGPVTASSETVPSKPILPAFNFSNFLGSNQIAPSAHLTSPTSPNFNFGNNNVDTNKSFTPFNFGTSSSSKTESFGQPPILAQATTVNSPFLLHTLPNQISSNIQSGAVNDFLHISPITPYPNLYPIFTNARLVGYTTHEITFNPALHLKTEPFIHDNETESRKLAATWKNFYEHIKETGGSLYPSIKAGEFILDESPSVKLKEKEILNASATVWNNPLLDNADLENDEASHNHNNNVKVETWRKWEAVEFKFQHNHYPFIESKFQNKQRSLLLQTHNIFKTQSGQIEQNSKLNKNFTVFSNGSNFYQTESEQLTTNPRPPQLRLQSGESKGSHQRRATTERNSSTGKHLANTDLPKLLSDGAFGRNLRFCARLNSNTPRRYHRKTKSKNNKMEENRGEASSEKENCADENLIPLLTRTTPSHKNKTGNNSDDSYDSTKRVDRCRRPRSKSLSVRPRGKSCGVHLTRERYYCIPSIPTMDRMVDEEGRCLVENFEVGHLDYGHMVFQGIMDVAGINLDELIVFKLKEMFLYPATDADFDLPLRLQKLNQPAVVTLFQVWPQRVGTNEFIRDVQSINTINYENLLKKTCDKMGVSFLSYDPNKGQWQFKIQDKAAVSQCDSLLS